MAKKSSSKKTAPAVASPLSDLALLLRQAADEAERLSPIIDLAATQQSLNSLEAAVTAWREQLRKNLLLSEDEFAAIQPAWAETWQLAKAELVAEVAGSLGDSESKTQKPEKDADYRNRLLLAVLQKGGVKNVNQFISKAKDKWQQKQNAQPSAAVSHVSDREANEYLKAWGKMTEQEFLAASKTLDQNLIKRASELVGPKVSKVTPASMKSFHKKAQRFARNTGA